VPSLPFVGTWELIALVAVLALLFGPKHVGRVAGRLGREVNAVKRDLTLTPPEDEAEAQK
jgi:Sec-independent protein translocase protein TatA